MRWKKSQRSRKGHPFPLWCQLLLSDRQQPTWCFLSLGPILPPAGLSRDSLPCRDDKNEGDATEGGEHVSLSCSLVLKILFSCCWESLSVPPANPHPSPGFLGGPLFSWASLEDECWVRLGQMRCSDFPETIFYILHSVWSPYANIKPSIISPHLTCPGHLLLATWQYTVSLFVN